MSILRRCALRLLESAGPSSRFAAGQLRAFSAQETSPGAWQPRLSNTVFASVVYECERPVRA